MDGQSIQTLTIEKIAPGGAGLGRLDGRVVFVPHTLPGEDVELSLAGGGRNFARARLLRVLSPSERRIAPRCPLFTVCGGCDFQHMSYPDQAAVKKDLFRETFRRIGGIHLGGDVAFGESPPFGYRSRVQAHRAPGGGWGYKEAASSRVVGVASCPVAVPEINLFFAGKADAAPPPGRDRAALFGAGGRLFARDDEEIEVVLLGKRLLFSTGCFFQSNLFMLEKMLAGAFEGLSGDLALDLYGGVGVFGAFLADRFRRVVLVEENPAAAEFARRNLPRDAAEVFSGSVEAWLSSRRGGRPDLVLVDPPRSGLSPAARDFLVRERPPVVVYVSCDPATLARDAARLLAGGYELREVRIFDFYPQTAHVESLCRFVLSS